MFSFWQRLTGYEARRKRLLNKAPQGPLKDFLSEPFPTLRSKLDELSILALDFETTGLNAINDKILSIGFVTMNQLSISLATAYHEIIHSEGSLKADNVIIHQITDDAKDAGQKLDDVVPVLLESLKGKVMLVHYQSVEREFLNAACQLLYGMPLVVPVIDTMQIERQRLDRGGLSYDPSDLKLAKLRSKYNLPGHSQHNALSDAVATAELFLAQQAKFQFDELGQVVS